MISKFEPKFKILLVVLVFGSDDSELDSELVGSQLLYYCTRFNSILKLLEKAKQPPIRLQVTVLFKISKMSSEPEFESNPLVGSDNS